MVGGAMCDSEVVVKRKLLSVGALATFSRKVKVDGEVMQRSRARMGKKMRRKVAFEEDL